MSKLIYIDTNVYIDYFSGRSSWLIPSGEIAFSLVNRTISCEFKLVFSDHLLKELMIRVSEDKIFGLIEMLKINDKIVNVSTTSETKILASKISKSKSIHYADALHYAIALIAKAEAIVTNDKGFQEISSIELPILPPNSI